ncbi:hypothetical protein [Caballeronia concitans]|uniref:hypothetical protein n=1 Tax=Caballeronia concitans TaxID=1777133 RepID=UPI0011810E90|nr:hypothetical protein [Caballeronia concitans]
MDIASMKKKGRLRGRKEGWVGQASEYGLILNPALSAQKLLARHAETKSRATRRRRGFQR